MDLISADARDRVPGMGELVRRPPDAGRDRASRELKQAELEQQFYPWSVFLSRGTTR